MKSVPVADGNVAVDTDVKWSLCLTTSGPGGRGTAAVVKRLRGSSEPPPATGTPDRPSAATNQTAANTDM